MRCLWLETENVNYPAIGFYRRAGFRLCGLDDILYRPGDPGLLPGEVLTVTGVMLRSGAEACSQ
jgi:ribosomal protein S18 acetylase RimI-like enzyme